MAYVCIALAYVASLVMVVHYYRAVRRWDDEQDALAAQRLEKALPSSATCQACLDPCPNLPTSTLSPQRDRIFITGLSAGIQEQVLEISKPIALLHKQGTVGRMRQFVRFSLN
jgi:hypothetical protein